jgi:small subunit ribosomal protein S6
LKTYEAMVLLDNREVKKGWDATREMVKSILAKHGAEVVVAKRWDERKLAYEINKQKRATYMLSYFKCDPGRVDEIKRELTLTEPVLRHVILHVDGIPPEAYEPEKEFGEVRTGEDETQARSEPATPAAATPAADAPAADVPEAGGGGEDGAAAGRAPDTAADAGAGGGDEPVEEKS